MTFVFFQHYPSSPKIFHSQIKYSDRYTNNDKIRKSVVLQSYMQDILMT